MNAKQEKILEFIKVYIALKGYPPTLREIAGAGGIASTSNVNYHLNIMVIEGIIERKFNSARAIKVIE